MATANTIQSSFLLGEVSPRWLGNIGKQEYFEALKTLENAIPISQGGVQKRVGSRLQTYTLQNFVRESTGATVASVTDIVSRYQNDFRLFKYYTTDGKRWWIIAVNDTINEWCILDPDAGLLYPFVGDAEAASGPGFANPHYPNPWAYSTNGLIFSSFYGTRLDYSNVDLAEIQVEQVGDVLLIVHKDMPPITVRYLLTGHFNLTPASNYYFPCASIYHSAFMPRNGTLADNTEFQQAVPFLEPNQSNNYGLGAITFPGLGAAGIGFNTTINSSLGIFTSAWVGTIIRLTDVAGLQSGVYFIYQFNSATSVNVTLIAGVQPNIALSYGTGANTYWEESAWSNKNGYPRAVTAFNNRVLYMGTDRNPNRIWCSAVGDIDELCEIPCAQASNYSTYLDDPSRAFTIDLIGADTIQWATVGKRVFIGANNKEFVLYSPEAVFGPETYRVDTATTIGSAYRQPVRSSSEVIFIPRSGQRMRTVVFSFQEDDYKSQDISRYAEHIARDSFTNLSQEGQRVPLFEDISLQTSPEPRIWVTDNNGGLSCCVFDREGGIVAWARQKLGGTPIGTAHGINTPYVAAIIPTPALDNTVDEITMIVKRKVNGVNKVFVETIGGYFNLAEYTHEYFNPLAGYSDYLTTRAVFLDCAQGAVASPATNSFTFANMANETLSVVADGRYLGEYTLSGLGVLTLEENYSEVIVGYQYDTIIETVDYEIPGTPSSNTAKYKQAVETFLSLYRTSFLQIKRSGQSAYQTIDFVQDSNPSDSYINAFTGLKRVHLGDVGRTFNLTILHRHPTPFELLAIVNKVGV